MTNPISRTPFPHIRLRLLALGDCNTRGAGDGQAIVDHMARRLQAVGAECIAVNWGHTMTTTREGLARVQQERPAPDVAILNYGLVDSWVTTIPRLYVPYYPETPAKRLVRKFLKSLKRRLRSQVIRHWIPRGEVVPLKEYAENFQAIIAALCQANPSVRIVIWSTAHVLNRPDRNANIDRYNEQMRRIAEESNCLYLETDRILGPGITPVCFADAVHLSDDSYRRLGVAMAELVLRQLGTIDSEAAGGAAA